MGRPKALLELEGRTFVHRVVRALAEGGCAPVLVVTAPGDDEVAAEARGAGARTVMNPDPGEGPITSLRLAIGKLDEAVAGLAYLPVDHPLVRPETVAHLLSEARASGALLTIPMRGNKRGHPPIFRRPLFAELADPALEGGARTVVHRHLGAAELVPVDDPGVTADIDTPESYRAAAGERS